MLLQFIINKEKVKFNILLEFKVNVCPYSLFEFIKMLETGKNGSKKINHYFMYLTINQQFLIQSIIVINIYITKFNLFNMIQKKNYLSFFMYLHSFPSDLSKNFIFVYNFTIDLSTYSHFLSKLSSLFLYILINV